jgi:hypothetical protein
MTGVISAQPDAAAELLALEAEHQGLLEDAGVHVR